jgi:hypothetical protein
MVDTSLTEPKIKSFISATLKECSQFKKQNINIIFNIFMFILFFVVIGGFLMYKYKGKLTDREIMERNKKKQEYIFKKIQQISIEKKMNEEKESQDIITNLPIFDRY